jgi:glyoxylase-like metal-dependent hydrolase (beta-lactamase superfamily II)
MAIPAAGKSPGEVALRWPARRILFVGDAVIGNPPGRLSLLPEAKLDDPVRLRASVRALSEMDVDTILTGDGVSILTGAKAALQALVASFPQS